MGRRFAVVVEKLNDAPWIVKVISKGIKVVSDWMPQWQRLERYVEKHPQSAEDFVEVRHALGGEPTGYVRVSNADASHYPWPSPFNATDTSLAP